MRWWGDYLLASGGQGDDLEIIAVFDGGRREIGGTDGLVVELGDDGFSGETEGFEKGVEGGFLFQGMRLAVELDGHGSGVV